MRARITTSLVLLLVSVLCLAQYSDEQLMQAYLRQDMTVWQKYLDSSHWEQLSSAERSRLINYEYGYTAYAIDAGHKDAQQRLDTYLRHIEEHRSQLSPARYHMYLSGAKAYDYKLHTSRLFSSGLEAYKLCGRAMKLDPNDPHVITLKGNVEFYAPAAFGGSKKDALALFQRAHTQYQKMPGYQHLWNYAASWLCLAQCYDKTGQTERAIQECQAILRAYPGFVYVRNEYLPQLKKKK